MSKLAEELTDCCRNEIPEAYTKYRKKTQSRCKRNNDQTDWAWACRADGRRNEIKWREYVCTTKSGTPEEDNTAQSNTWVGSCHRFYHVIDIILVEDFKILWNDVCKKESFGGHHLCLPLRENVVILVSYSFGKLIWEVSILWIPAPTLVDFRVGFS